MARKDIGTGWDRNNRNAINDNFKEVFNKTSLLNESLEELVLEGSLTDEQFTELITAVNGLVKKGELSVNDIDKSLGLLDQTFMTEEFLQQMAGDTPINTIPADESLTTKKYADKSITPEKTNFFISDDNLFDGHYEPWIMHPITGGNMRVSKEALGENGSLAIIPVKSNTTYTVKSHDVALTDAFRIGLSNRPFEFSPYDIFNLDTAIVMGDTTVPEREYTFTTTKDSQLAFIYVSKTGKKPKLKIEEGKNSTDFKELHINPKFIKLNENELKESKKVVSVKSQEMYSVPSLESVNKPDSTYKIHEQNSASMYALYDSLVADYSSYISKELFATETTGKEVYQYNFKPEKPNVFRTDAESDFLHFFIISGVHGSEKAGWWCLYESMKQICENWKDSEVLEAFRWNVEFTVVPLVNVYGIDNPGDPATFNGKINANGVDINRNFPVGFAVGTPGDIGYGGSEPLTEPESIAIADYLNNNSIDFYADFHNFSSQSDPNVFMWNIVESQRELNMSSYYFSHLSQKWKKQDELFPQADDVFFGHSSPGTGGSTPPFVNSLGIKGGIFEISHTMHPKKSKSQYSSEVITLGTEAQLNWLYMAYRNLIN